MQTYPQMPPQKNRLSRPFSALKWGDCFQRNAGPSAAVYMKQNNNRFIELQTAMLDIMTDVDSFVFPVKATATWFPLWEE